MCEVYQVYTLIHQSWVICWDTEQKSENEFTEVVLA